MGAFNSRFWNIAAPLVAVIFALGIVGLAVSDDELQLARRIGPPPRCAGCEAFLPRPASLIHPSGVITAKEIVVVERCSVDDDYWRAVREAGGFARTEHGQP